MFVSLHRSFLSPCYNPKGFSPITSGAKLALMHSLFQFALDLYSLQFGFLLLFGVEGLTHTAPPLQTFLILLVRAY